MFDLAQNATPDHSEPREEKKQHDHPGIAHLHEEVVYVRAVVRRPGGLYTTPHQETGHFMVWVRLSDDINEHPKIARLDDHGLSLFIAGLAYSNRNTTDGFIPKAVGLGQLRYCEGHVAEAIAQLVETVLWVPVDRGWQIHDFGQYQPSRAEVMQERAAKKNARVSGGQQRDLFAKRGTDGRYSSPQVDGGENSITAGGTGNGSISAGGTVSDQLPHQLSTSPVPVPVPGTRAFKPVPEPKAKNISLDFDLFYKIYPLKIGKRAARTAFERALKRASVDSIVAGTKRYRDDPNRDAKFTAHPSTWLNRDGWDDDPQPPRQGANHGDDLQTRIARGKALLTEEDEEREA